MCQNVANIYLNQTLITDCYTKYVTVDKDHHYFGIVDAFAAQQSYILDAGIECQTNDRIFVNFGGYMCH